MGATKGSFSNEKVCETVKMSNIFSVALNLHDHNTYDGVWHNQNATISDVVNCTDDDMFFNIWARLEDETAEELDQFIEEQLVPNGLRILADTEMASKDGNAVRFMIARPLSD